MAIKCKECGRVMVKQTPAHLRFKHNMTFEEYWAKHGRESEEVIAEQIPHPLDDKLETEEMSLLTPSQKDYVLARASGLGKAASMERIGLSKSTLSSPNWRKRLIIAEAIISRLCAEPLLKAQYRILQGSERAAERLTELVDDSDPRVALSASDSVLDRSGIVKRPSQTLAEDFRNWTTQQLDEAIEKQILQAGIEEDIVNGEIIAQNEPIFSKEWQRLMWIRHGETMYRNQELLAAVHNDSGDLTEEQRLEILDKSGLDYRNL